MTALDTATVPAPTLETSPAATPAGLRLYLPGRGGCG